MVGLRGACVAAWIAAGVVLAGLGVAEGAARARGPRAARGVASGPAPVPLVGRCPVVSEAPDTVAAIRAAGEVALGSGRVVQLVDVRVSDDVSPPTWLAGLAGSPVSVRVVGAADRWGRVPAAVLVVADEPVDLAARMVGEGLAAVDAGERDGLCDPALLAVEAGARQRSVGLWEPAPVIAADDGEALGARAGQFAVVEGRVVSVGERRERTYLNFGREWSRDFSVVVPRRLWAVLKGRLEGAESLRGRRVRVRGIVEAGERPPQVELSAADMLEVEARDR